MEFLINRLADAPPRRSMPWDACRFALARDQYAAIAPFANPAALSARLAVDDVETRERFALSRALVALYQDDACPLWSELVLRNYARLITGVRAKVHLGRLQHHDVDQMVMLTFLDLVRKVDLAATGEYVSRALARDLRRDLHRALKYERRELDCIEEHRGAAMGAKGWTVDTAHVEAGAIWASLARGHDAARLAEHILLATDSGLRSHIYETVPGSDEDRERVYQQQKRAVTRFAQHARESVDADLARTPTARVRKYLEKRHGLPA